MAHLVAQALSFDKEYLRRIKYMMQEIFGLIRTFPSGKGAGEKST